MSQSKFVSLCRYLMSCDTPLSNLYECSTWRVFQPNFENILNIFLELSVRQIRRNCRTTLLISPGTSFATIVTIWCSHRDCEYFLYRINRKQGSTATPTVTSSFDSLYFWSRKLHTVCFIRVHQREYWNALTTDQAATIVRFTPVQYNTDKVMDRRQRIAP